MKRLFIFLSLSLSLFWLMAPMQRPFIGVLLHYGV